MANEPDHRLPRNAEESRKLNRIVEVTQRIKALEAQIGELREELDELEAELRELTA